MKSSLFINLKDLINQAKFFEKSNLEIENDENQNAYMIYTSGSTGDPKGVEVTNKNLLILLQAAYKKFNFNENDVWTLFHSYAFDFAMWEIFACLLQGSELLIINQLIAKSPSDFYEIVAKHQVTVLNQTPTAFKTFIREDLSRKKNLALKYIIFGGERLNFASLTPWVERHPLKTTALINMYGITETTVHVSFYEIQTSDLHSTKSIIGKPLSHLGIYISNVDGNILPPGIEGEICIYGLGVTRGYYNKDNLTQEKFIKLNNCPYILYKSGDLGKINFQGDVEYHGRIDKQIQLRGFRVELGEIESHIIRSGFVGECCIDVTGTITNNDLRLVAFIVPNTIYSQSLLLKYLKKYLPTYMIPSLYVPVDRIPLTINGKVDLNLLNINLDEIALTIKGSSKTEKFLYKITANIIKGDHFEVSDNLFDIGITSIDLLDIFDKVNQHYSIPNLNLLDIIEFPTIAAFANHIDTQLRSMQVAI